MWVFGFLGYYILRHTIWLYVYTVLCVHPHTHTCIHILYILLTVYGIWFYNLAVKCKIKTQRICIIIWVKIKSSHGLIKMYIEMRCEHVLLQLQNPKIWTIDYWVLKHFLTSVKYFLVIHKWSNDKGSWLIFFNQRNIKMLKKLYDLQVRNKVVCVQNMMLTRQRSKHIPRRMV